MIVMNVTYTCKDGKRESFLEKIKEAGIDVACRKEAGNIKYDYYYAAEGKDELFLLEKWADAEALEEHFRQPHFLRLGELKTEYVEDVRLERYEL